MIIINTNPRAVLKSNVPLPIRIQDELGEYAKKLPYGDYQIKFLEDSIRVYEKQKGLIRNIPLLEEELHEIKLYT